MSYIMSKDRGIVQEGEMSGECLRGICPGGNVRIPYVHMFVILSSVAAKRGFTR